jgi:phosphatidylinositol alpha-1,6-mannosyltransferase
MSHKRLKVLIVTMDYPPRYGGLGSVTYALEKGLRAAGVLVRLLNFDGSSISNRGYLSTRDLFYTSATRNSHFAPHKILNPLSSLAIDGGFRDFVYNNMIYRISQQFIKQFKPDIIHITRAKLYCAVFGVQEPIVANCHAEEVRKAYPIQYIANNAAKILCYSNYTRNLLVGLYPQSTKRTELMHPPIDVKKYRTSDKRPRRNQVVVMSRLEKAKNIDTVVKSIEYVPAQILSKYRFLIIGEGTEEDRLKKLTDKLHLDNVVTFCGGLSENEKIALLKESKLYVLCPKRYDNMAEAFGITFLEAQAAGLPVIASRIGGIPEAVGNGGIYIDDVDNPREIADKMTRMLTDSQLYSRTQDNILDRINNFDTNRWIAKLLIVYRSLLGRDDI